ncbi:MAG: hypothetical protein ACLPUO_00980 [Streptosporangiaceae bacterium]|jgi:hypothetical protein
MTAVTNAPDVPAPAAPASRQTAEQLATQWANDYAARLTERAQSVLRQAPASSNGAVRPAIGELSSGANVAFDVAVTSPIQFINLPPYQPSKIIADTEAAFIVAFMFVNPVWPPMPPATTQLGSRSWRMSLDQFNLTTGAVLPEIVVAGTFAPTAPVLTPVVFALATPNPGPDPWLIEANVTVDIGPGQPYAAFATNFFDVDQDPAFLGIPPTVPGWRNELPNRYLLYGK